MKLTLAKNNRAFTRTQWLVVICLSVVAFEVGVRYAENHYASSPPIAKATVPTNTPPKAILLTAKDPMPEEFETTLLPETNAPAVHVRRAPPTNTYVRPPATAPGPRGQVEILKGDGSISVRKVVGPRPLILPPGSDGNYGVRIVVP